MIGHYINPIYCLFVNLVETINILEKQKFEIWNFEKNAWIGN